MAARCAVCGKGPQVGYTVSHSHIRNKRTFRPNMLVTLGIIFTIGIIFSPVFAKVIILIVAAGHFYYFLCRIKTVEEQENMELENECE